MTCSTENPTKLLLHACCGPCSMEPVRLLRERGIEPCVYYANPNIHPAQEYRKRLDTIRTWARGMSLEVVEGAYDVEAWEAAAGRVGDQARERYGVITCDVTDAAAVSARTARCRACYRLRFQEAARYAAAHGFDTLGTTLSVSPYQYTEVIREELERAASRAGLRALFEDYRPYYDNATRRSRAEGLYRQNYCGCRFSDEEAAAERTARREARAAKRAQKAAENAGQRAAQEQELAAKREMRQAYAAKQARKHAVLKALRESRAQAGEGERASAGAGADCTQSRARRTAHDDAQRLKPDGAEHRAAHLTPDGSNRRAPSSQANTTASERTFAPHADK